MFIRYIHKSMTLYWSYATCTKLVLKFKTIIFEFIKSGYMFWIHYTIPLGYPYSKLHVNNDIPTYGRQENSQLRLSCLVERKKRFKKASNKMICRSQKLIIYVLHSICIQYCMCMCSTITMTVRLVEGAISEWFTTCKLIMVELCCFSTSSSSGSILRVWNQPYSLARPQV
jgi:hypothetical protein